MDFRELNYVLAIAKYQNITKAAESLYVGQPTLSKFLIALENELGLKLFRKMGHRYILTYAGERYAEKAAQILQLKHELSMELTDMVKRDVGVINVAFANMRCTYMLPCTLPAFQDLHPNVKVNVFEGTSDENDRRLLDGQIDVAFYSKPGILNPLIEYKTLGEEELLICTCKNHPVSRFAQPNPASRYPKLDLTFLKNEKILMMQPKQRTRQIMDSYMQKQGFKFENMLCTSNLSAIMELVSVGYGISFIFEPHLLHRRDSQPIECYSFGEPRMVSHFVAACRKGSYLSHYVQDFIEVVCRLHAGQWRDRKTGC
ncbi:MAG: LysR family transcriptional regulator [Lachnospiraceae bacterium]|nr:LysR family transcriptional regulator [Lachnospiraceae bacterium]